MKYSKDEIIKIHQSGKKLKYLFFWGHQPSRNGEITGSCLSQWYSSKLVIDGFTYLTVEHSMMAEKARLFSDENSLEKILNSKSPGEAKAHGRNVIGFDQRIWDENRIEIVVNGNYHKFIQNDPLKEYLLNTKKRVLVEASPVDSIWGIGMSADNEFVSIPTKWKGLNLLGFALMEVRDMILNGENLG